MIQEYDGYTSPIYNTRLGRLNIYTSEPYITRCFICCKVNTSDECIGYEETS